MRTATTTAQASNVPYSKKRVFEGKKKVRNTGQLIGLFRDAEDSPWYLPTKEIQICVLYSVRSFFHGGQAVVSFRRDTDNGGPKDDQNKGQDSFNFGSDKHDGGDRKKLSNHDNGRNDKGDDGTRYRIPIGRGDRL